MSEHRDFLAPAPIELPADPAKTLIDEGKNLNDVIVAVPTSSLAWAELAEDALRSVDVTAAQSSTNNLHDDHLHAVVAAYAYARTGYHRGLDALRTNGWKGWGSVPWSHEPNRGVLRAIAALARAARAIGEANEYDRCRTLLEDSDPSCVSPLIDDQPGAQ
ncbi:DUF3151 domain-containing protein [Corynebacterium kroppenstedtii]|jgi:hypothetical protein|uniref:DUF3151 domain-containing protein n=1 Tax=Corynebacterium kroppenstedtii TaxID=161879 RepID=A0A2W5V7S3_9CORY|nr:DUF3151 domain-containing protein [Corynebacterium kroppenstedtii]MDU7286437.1 DUF3151 domain-containing protein [Corynebacterium kroppenstedtii]PZR06161.1 MAG: DUF3151 domain-containing protein [Corynebacterium kroppenstedtii]